MKLVRFFVAILISTLVLTGAHAQAIKATIDPSELAVGSRPLALGRAYVGIADDVYSIYSNVAGLARIKNWQVASMYANLISEVDYSLIGFASPLSREAIGISYLKSAVSGSIITKRDPVTDRIVPDGDLAIGYTSAVWFFSYAVSPAKYFALPFFEDLSLGFNFKVFQQSLTGIPTRELNAIGTDIDVGVQYRPTSWFTLGFAGYNVLPYENGGKLIWQSGITESIPASAKVGVGLKLLGKDGIRELIYFPQELLIDYDYEFAFKESYPSLSHFGVEWRPLEYLSLRAGLDQDAIALSSAEVGIDNNFSVGIGVQLSDFSFDYTFHTFGVLADNNTHFFSISYGIPREKLPDMYKPPELETFIKITEPASRSVTFLPGAVVKGRVVNPIDVKAVRINDVDASVFEDYSFISVVKFPRYGLNYIKLDAISTTGRIIDTTFLKVARLVPFKDVGEGDPQRIDIGAMAALEYVKGYKDGTFRPKGEITRAELCTLLVRIATTEAKSPARKTFKDVPVRHWAARFIEEAVRRGYFKGYPDGTFRPNNEITRAEAVNVLVNFAPVDKVHYVYEQPFTDVNVSHWAAKNIFLAKKYGFLDYLSGKKFELNRQITRGEVVEILSKIDPVKTQLRELLE